jgi:hypothetical protein
VFLSYACPRGRALIDRRVYLPKSWASDPKRCTAAGIPAEVKFATKPELALEMITEAVAAREDSPVTYIPAITVSWFLGLAVNVAANRRVRWSTVGCVTLLALIAGTVSWVAPL